MPTSIGVDPAPRDRPRWSDNRLILQGLVDSFNPAGGGSVSILRITIDTSPISDANFKLEDTSIAAGSAGEKRYNN